MEKNVQSPAASARFSSRPRAFLQIGVPFPTAASFCQEWTALAVQASLPSIYGKKWATAESKFLPF